MVIFTSGGKRVFFKENFCYIGFTDKLFYIEFASKALHKYKLLLYLYILIHSILFKYF